MLLFSMSMLAFVSVYYCFYFFLLNRLVTYSCLGGCCSRSIYGGLVTYFVTVWGLGSNLI